MCRKQSKDISVKDKALKQCEELHPQNVNQIVPEELIPPCNSHFNVFLQRQMRRTNQFRAKKAALAKVEEV